MTHDGPVLQARGLTKHFPVRGWRSKKVVHAVDDVDLDLHRGAVVALVGESGSGKSTVARLLAHLLPVTAGEIRLDGAPVDAKGVRKLRRYVNQVQMTFQDPFSSLNAVHSVRYTLTRSIRLHHPALKGEERDAAVEALLERVHLRPAARYIDKFPHELSGGQRQRIAIARALGADPRVLLADEPVSMLDVSIRLGILDLLRELRDQMQIAILYITHDIASARYFADRTMVMYAGRVVETGDSEGVTQHPAHPYTQLLIRSAPDPDALAGVPPGDDGRTGVRGEPPSMADPPTGCRFNPRCPFAADLCRTEVPPLLTVGDGREAACWLYSDRSDAPTRDGAAVSS